jgi:hypothetical protein
MDYTYRILGLERTCDDIQRVLPLLSILTQWFFLRHNPGQFTSQFTVGKYLKCVSWCYLPRPSHCPSWRCRSPLASSSLLGQLFLPLPSGGRSRDPAHIPALVHWLLHCASGPQISFSYLSYLPYCRSPLLLLNTVLTLLFEENTYSCLFLSCLMREKKGRREKDILKSQSAHLQSS